MECLLDSYFVSIFQNQSYPIASSPTGPESPTHKENDSGSNTIEHHGPVDSHTASKQDIHEIIQRIKACCKGTEMLMSVLSTGLFKERGGGVYQTPKPTHIVNLLTKIYPHVCSVLDDFPHLTREPSVTMIDAGADMHISGVLFAALGGCHLIGLEINETRCALAADFLLGVAKYFPKAKLGLFNCDLVERGNWSKVVVIFFCDRVGETLTFFPCTILREI